MAVVPATNSPTDTRYLYYALLTEDFGEVTTGSAQPQITIGHLSKKEVFWAEDKHERAAIAHILGTLDDKIEVNRRMSETLEAMARALFKVWFVDFEPVRAKMEGRWRHGHPLPLPLGEGRGEGIPPLPPGEGRGEGPLPTKTHAKLPSDLLAFARELRRDETDAERLLWRLLRNRRLAGAKFRRQHPYPPYVLDFYCHELKLAIELDGGQHNLPESRLRDKARTAQSQAHGIRVLRFWDHEMLRQTESVLQAIYRAVIERLQELQPSPPAPLPAGEGSTPPGLPAHLYDLFPTRLVDSELGEIPEGWGVDQIGNHFRVTMGQSPPGNTYNEKGDGLPFYQGRVDFGFRFPTRRVFCTAPTRLAEAGDTLVTVRAPVGDSNMALERCCIGRGVAAVRHASGAVSYTYYFVRSLKSVFESFEAEGTGFGAITKDAFLSIKCVVPPTELVQRFEQLCRPIDEKIERAERESRTLAALRDALLPKLIRGEIRVKDAERFLKERGL